MEFFCLHLKFLLSTDQFKGGKSGLAQSKSCLDPQELLELLKSRDYERYVKFYFFCWPLSL